MIDSILPFALAHALCYIGLLYVPPSSYIRYLLFCLIAASSLVAVRSTVAGLVPGQIGYEYVIGFIFHASYWLLVAKLHPPPRSKASAQKWWAFNQIFDPRWDIVNPPPFRQDDPKYVPTRSRLFLSRLWDFSWTCTIMYLHRSYPINTVWEDFHYVPNGYLHRLSEVQPREAVIRHVLAISGYAIPYCALRASHSLATCIALAFGSPPKRWPPIFGSLSDAYTVRRWFS